jgi:hypothetical protein
LPSRKLLSYIEKEIWVTEFSLKKKSVSMAWLDKLRPTGYIKFLWAFSVCTAAHKYGDIICKLYEGFCDTFKDLRI